MSLIETKSGKLQLGTFRKAIIWGVIASLFAYLIGHLFYMQVYAPDRLIQEGNNRVVRHYSYEPPRGYIVDRNGKILALSIPVKEEINEVIVKTRMGERSVWNAYTGFISQSEP